MLLPVLMGRQRSARNSEEVRGISGAATEMPTAFHHTERPAQDFDTDCA